MECFSDGLLAYAGSSIKHRAAFLTADGLGAAITFPPGAGPPEGSGEAIISGIPDARRDLAFEVFARMSEGHPQQPHWHLRLIGVDPTRQGFGYGSRLLDKVLEACDELQIVAYLESTSERSRALYERHGFETIEEIRVADAPPLWPMLRQPRS